MTKKEKEIIENKREQQLIITDVHLSRGDKVKLDNQILEYIEPDGVYFLYKTEEGLILHGRFNFLVKEGEFYIPYQKPVYAT